MQLKQNDNRLITVLIIKSYIMLVLSCVWLSVTPWAVAHQAPLSMGFSRQEYWTGLPFPPPGDLPNSGMEPLSPALEGKFFPTEPSEKPQIIHTYHKKIIKYRKKRKYP